MIEGVGGTRRVCEHTVSETSKQSDGAKHSGRRANAGAVQRRITSGVLQSHLHARTVILEHRHRGSKLAQIQSKRSRWIFFSPIANPKHIFR
jgi:hypothetical protein